MFGDDDSWQDIAEWLKGLDADKVLRYFEGRRYTTRLGDHFAACIEYVLKFSPLLLPDPLFISQQVGACTIQNQQALKKLKKSKGEFGSFGLRKGGVMSEVIVKLIENDILIKRFSSYLYDGRGRVKEISDPEIESLMDDFKNSPFDYHAHKEMQATPSGKHGNGSRDASLLHESMFTLPENPGLDVRKVYKWRVNYISDGKNIKLLTDHKVLSYGLPLKTTNGHGLKSESVDVVVHGIDKNNNAASDRGLVNILSNGKKSEGEKKPSRKVHLSIENVSTVWRNPIKKHTLNTNLRTGQKAGPTKSLKQHVELEKGRTAGECDFLFKANTKKDSLDYAWTHVHHWEVSVHFLSYIGPWEVFGLVTPGSSAWHCSGKRLLAAIEGLDPAIYLEALYQPPNANSWADQVSVLDACYVAPTIGDTWCDRKKSLSSKLGLCRYPNMAAKVSNLFHSSLEESCSFIQEDQVQETMIEQKPLYGPQGQDYARYREDPSIFRVIPRALAKGYLFYEPKLWLHLCMRKDQGKLPIQAMKDDNSQRLSRFSTSSLNANHWMGWWVYACDFAEFARSYGCKGSMWYIAPRNEWLSPIVIGSSESHRCRRVLDLVDMLTMILKVGEEAAELQPPRQRRFMVVEVHWDPDTTTTVARPPSLQLQTKKYHRQVENLQEKGGWVEVSRGFVVEKSWPESREQLAHGFTLSWSPALLGWS